MSNKVVQIEAKNLKIIAPCGINCGLCRAYIRDSQPCYGCRSGGCRDCDSNKSKTCRTCAIMNCTKLAAGNHRFCFSCADYPCAKLLHLDRRYRTKYGVSVMENLGRIKSIGVKRFVAEETTKWACPECGSRLSMHKPECGNCGYTWQGKLL
jgi:hypothetical protein